MPATSPTTSDADRLRRAEQLIVTLRQNVQALKAALDDERARSGTLYAAVLDLLPLEPEEGHRHLLNDPHVCCLMVASKIDAQARRRALRAVEAYVEGSVGQGEQVAS